MSWSCLPFCFPGCSWPGPTWPKEGGSLGGGGPVQGGAELEKPAGLEQSAQTRSSRLPEASQRHSLPPCAPEGLGPATWGFGLETSGEGESAWALSWD